MGPNFYSKLNEQNSVYIAGEYAIISFILTGVSDSITLNTGALLCNH